MMHISAGNKVVDIRPTGFRYVYVCIVKVAKEDHAVTWNSELSSDELAYGALPP